MNASRCTRREFHAAAAGALALATTGRAEPPAEPFRLKYILASPMYGTMPLAEILPEARKIGAAHIDIWPRVHANHREQVEEMGHDRFARLLDEHRVSLGMSTRYDLGPHRLTDEIEFLAGFGGKVLVTGSRKLQDGPLKQQVKAFVESMKPHVAKAERHGVAIGIENHGNALIHSPDSLRYFAEFATSPHLGIALAPYHLPQDPELIAELIVALGDSLVHFQGWEHGMGSHQKLPKEQEMLQMPGRGTLDFTPMLAALKKIDYGYFTEIFMHPVPRGIPILDSREEITAAINQSRDYLEACLTKT